MIKMILMRMEVMILAGYVFATGLKVTFDAVQDCRRPVSEDLHTIVTINFCQSEISPDSTHISVPCISIILNLCSLSKCEMAIAVFKANVNANTDRLYL